MRYRVIVAATLGLTLTTWAVADNGSMRMHDCLMATATSPVTVTSGTSTNGADVIPLGAAQNLSGFVTFTGAGKLTVTVQTRMAGKTTWYTPKGGSPLTAVSAGSYHFFISVPPCEALRLVYAATVANIGITEAFALDQ